MYIIHDYLREQLQGTENILCKESAADYLNLSNGTLSEDITFYSSSEGKEVIFLRGIWCTTVNQTINDLLEDNDSDEQVLLESLSNYYYKNNESFQGLTIEEKNQERFLELKEAAIGYYDD